MATVTFGDFEWDADKAADNEAKHRVTFEEAVTVFLDLDYLLVRDALAPERFVAIGLSSRARILFVVHCERAERLRIISARRATRQAVPTATRISMWNRYIAGEYGGMNEVIARLTRMTGDRRFLECARLFDNINFFYGDA